jgi:uncharacterized protein
MSESALIAKLSQWRQALARFASGGSQRDYDRVFDYPPSAQLDSRYYRDLYERGGIANRVAKAYPQSTWREMPTLCDEKDAKESEFSKAWDDFCEKKRLGHYLERADRLNCLGQYSILFIGSSGKPTEPLVKGGKILYLQPYAEHSVTIAAWESDTESPRFGMPLTYTLQTADVASSQATGNSRSITVHYSRVLHIAESLEQSETYGTPLLKPIVNYLVDLKKVAGSSAECFWLTAHRGLFLGVKSEGYVDEEMLKAIREQAEEFTDQLKRVVVGANMDANALVSDVPDPTANIDKLIALIAGTTGIPQRILTGSEQGQLASGQDEGNWASRIDERRGKFAGPLIVKPLAELAIFLGELPEPQGEWKVDWPKASGISETERADIAVKKTTALKNYITAPGADSVVAPEEVREWCDLNPESDYELVEPEEIPLDETDPNVTGLPGDPADPDALPVDPNAPPAQPGQPPKPGAPVAKVAA